jgi:DNA-binding SARP family transcriptional activator
MTESIVTSVRPPTLVTTVPMVWSGAGPMKGAGVSVVTTNRHRHPLPHSQGSHRLALLARFCLVSRADGAEITLPQYAQRLLAFLALSRGPQDRGLVSASLWLGTIDQRAAASLRTTLWKLRQIDEDLVVADARTVCLGPGVSVDFDEAIAQARSLLGPAGEATDATAAARAWTTFDDELLPGWYDDWVIFERERFRQLRLHALEGLSQQLTRLGRHAEAVDAAQAAVAAEPLRETAQRVLIAAHIAEGNRSEARRQLALYTELLRDELGVEPSGELRTLLDPADLAGQSGY